MTRKIVPPVMPSVKLVSNARKLILRNFQSPGDLVMMAYSIKALHKQYPDKYITDVRSSSMDVFEGNPYITPIADGDPDATVLNMEYPTIHRSNQNTVHFANSFIDNLSHQLKIELNDTEWSDTVMIREEEEYWFSVVREILGKDVPYWVVDAGHKLDYTAKAWGFDRFQKVIDSFPNVTFVQIGLKAPGHFHPELKGNNLINLLGKTDTRQLIRLVYNAFGVLTPVSFPMVLAYAIKPHARFNRKSRACVVIAGGREPNHWQQGPNQQFIHTCGMLPCCDLGGCWRSRVVRVNDGDNKDNELCHFPVLQSTGQVIPKCMDMISVEEVCLSIKKYMDNLGYRETI